MSGKPTEPTPPPAPSEWAMGQARELADQTVGADAPAWLRDRFTAVARALDAARAEERAKALSEAATIIRALGDPITGFSTRPAEEAVLMCAAVEVAAQAVEQAALRARGGEPGKEPRV